MWPRAWLSIPLLVALVVPARAARELAGCATLVPLRPAAVRGRGPRRCQRALAEAGRAYVDRALETQGACLDRWRRGTLAADDPVAECRGLVLVSSGELQPPADADTAAALAEAEAAARALVLGRCDDAAAAQLGACAPTAAGLADCLLADHRGHVQHVLDAELQQERPGGGAECAAVIAAEGRRFLGSVQRAMAGCLNRLQRKADRVDLAARCLGGAADGQIVPPGQRATRRKIGRAELRLQTKLSRACSRDDLIALDACSDDPDNLPRCLVCRHCREAILLTQGQRGGTAAPAADFLDWGALRNPILERADAMLKDQTVAYRDGWFHLFGSTRFEPDDPDAATKERSFFRSRDLRAWEPFHDDDLNPAGTGVGSPEVVPDDAGGWLMTFQGRPAGAASDEAREIFLSTSPDLLDWTPPVQLTDGLVPGTPIIDGALAHASGHWFLLFKDRLLQTTEVARSVGALPDGRWEPPLRSITGSDHPILGFAENYQVIRIDGRWRLVATARDPEPYRCDTPAFFIYTCSHEPFIYTLSGDGSGIAHWTAWGAKRWLRVPYEAWNPIMHANTGFLADWRAYDGFFYLFYSGAADGERFEGRGHGKIGVARSRDLLHWRVAGDLRD